MAVYPTSFLGSSPIGDSDLRYHHIPGKGKGLIMLTAVVAVVDNVMVTRCRQARLFKKKHCFFRHRNKRIPEEPRNSTFQGPSCRGLS